MELNVIKMNQQENKDKKKQTKKKRRKVVRLSQRIMESAKDRTETKRYAMHLGPIGAQGHVRIGLAWWQTRTSHTAHPHQKK